MNVCLCCIGRLENRYAVEYVEYYKKLGFNNIFIIDNNHNNEEYFEDVLQPYIDTGFVKIISKYRNLTSIQYEAYIDVYNNYLKDYDWCAFFDFDEYLTLSVDTSIKDYLSRQEFKYYNQICINWKIYTDNNLVYDDGRPCLERFTEPADINVHIDDEEHYGFTENMHVKSIIRCNLLNISCSSPHNFSGELLDNNTCVNNGSPIVNISACVSPINYDLAYIKHFPYKTIEEFLKNKYVKGIADRNVNDYHKLNLINYFFIINKKTKEKENYINNFFKKSKLKLFVLTHKEITSLKYDPSYMIPLYNNKCHNDMDDFNDKCMYETYMIYDVYKNQDKYFDDNTKYIGFCHYRRYFDIDYNNAIDLLDNNKIILSEKQEFTESVLQQYNICHDSLDNDFKVIKTIIDNNYPEYTNDLIEFLNQNTMSVYNMFICNKQIFNEYCSWVFDIMQQYFKYYNINNYVDMYKFEIEHINKYPCIRYTPNDYYHSIEYQCHIGGFLAERLLNVFFLHNYRNNIEYINVIVDN